MSGRGYMWSALVLLGLSAWSVAAWAQQKHVVCGDCSLQTVASALEMAQPHDTILIRKGHYLENQLYIRKPLVLMGERGAILDAQGGDEILIIQSNHVEVRGLTLSNIGLSYTKDRAAIRVEKSNHCIIADNQLINTFFGIYLAHVEKTVVRGNKLIGEAKTETQSANGIHLWYCDSIQVMDNYITGHRDGIYFEFVNNSLIEHNVSVRNMRYGLHFMFSDHDTYRHNRFEHNGVGVAVMYSRWIFMEDNVFAENWGAISYGILLKDIRDGHMKRNHFEHNATAIYAEGVNRMDITHNNFIDNGWAFRIMANCEDVQVMFNNFIGNSFEVATNSTYNVNTFSKNYWSGYSGYDLNRDGYGDVPYRPVRLFSYLVEKIPSSIILMRSPFVSLLEHTERVAPTLTPETLVDPSPSMKKIKW